MADMSVYDGIISPNGGLYRPGPEVVFPSRGSELTTRKVETVAVDPFTGAPIVAGQGGNNAVRAALSGQFGTGIRADVGGSVNYQQPALPNQPDGSIVVGKSQERLNSPEYDFAYGDNGNPALDAIQTAATTVPLPRPRSANAPKGTLMLAFEPSAVGGQNMASSRGGAIQTPSGVVYQPMPQYGPPGVQQNPQVVQALAAQQAPTAPAPVLPSYTTTPFQEDRFQTTTGAQMPGSMNNSRWTTGY